tara:strand:- start:96 stop:215 length:120 start_codon:yes stop_codon:yes gene_type:complete
MVRKMGELFIKNMSIYPFLEELINGRHEWVFNHPFVDIY